MRKYGQRELKALVKDTLTKCTNRRLNHEKIHLHRRRAVVRPYH